MFCFTEMWLQFTVTVGVWIILSGLHPISTAPAEVWKEPVDPEATTTQAPVTTAPRGYVYPSFICPVTHCHRFHQSAERLKLHLVRSHSADPEAINSIPGMYQRGSYIYHCTECGLRFQTRRQFGHHFDEPPHVPEGRFACPHCGDRAVHESPERHREHLMYHHVEPRLCRGKPNDAARGEMDIHQPRTPDFNPYACGRPNVPGTPFLPMINMRDLMAGIASRSNVAISKKILSAKPAKRLTERERADAAAAAAVSRAQPACQPSQRLSTEAWPSFNPQNFQRVVTCNARRVEGAAANEASANLSPVSPGNRETGEPLWIRTYSQQGDPIPHRFA